MRELRAHVTGTSLASLHHESEQDDGDTCEEDRGGAQCNEAELFLQRVCKVFIKDADDDLNIWIQTASLQCDLQIHRVVLAGENDRPRFLNVS